MQFIDLAAQQRRIRDDVDRAIAGVLDHGRYIMGPEVPELEAALAAFVGAGEVVSCASGTDALVMALLVRGAGPGDAVFVPSFTFAATAESVAILGATPVFVDIDPVTYNLDPASLDAAVKGRQHGRQPMRHRILPCRKVMPLPGKMTTILMRKCRSSMRRPMPTAP